MVIVRATDRSRRLAAAGSGLDRSTRFGRNPPEGSTPVAPARRSIGCDDWSYLKTPDRFDTYDQPLPLWTDSVDDSSGHVRTVSSVIAPPVDDGAGGFDRDGNAARCCTSALPEPAVRTFLLVVHAGGGTRHCRQILDLTLQPVPVIASRSVGPGTGGFSRSN